MIHIYTSPSSGEGEVMLRARPDAWQALADRLRQLGMRERRLATDISTRLSTARGNGFVSVVVTDDIAGRIYAVVRELNAERPSQPPQQPDPPTSEPPTPPVPDPGPPPDQLNGLRADVALLTSRLAQIEQRLEKLERSSGNSGPDRPPPGGPSSTPPPANGQGDQEPFVPSGPPQRKPSRP